MLVSLNMRFLGVDYGTKRIGLAISDESGVLAFPKEIITNDSKVFQKLGKVIREENVSEIIVGESTNFSGAANRVSAQIEFFISGLKDKFHLPVRKQKEFLTSVEARKSYNGKGIKNNTQAHSKMKQSKTGKVDASAAALILQRYLDRRSKQSKA